eukprot:gnl/Chilomastix_cuspidata/1456.p1 GENE.gnl/Chilomastix_cuspidata/1456~~gnl/Chilomastix_cuspidata/1456.p1  ORF type:complete len:803 (-),score=258.30 gnl/Chilomastix_cuspidata/1456:822-3230(-)
MCTLSDCSLRLNIVGVYHNLPPFICTYRYNFKPNYQFFRGTLMKLEELTKLMGSTQKSPSPLVGSRIKNRASLFVRPLESPSAEKHEDEFGPLDSRDYAVEISKIRSVSELRINKDRVLTMHQGDLAIIQCKSFRCQPVAMHLADFDLLIRRLECVDRRTYDLKVFEADQHVRFSGHPNIVALYSFWAEEPDSAYTFKSLVMLLEDPLNGSMREQVVEADVRQPERTLLKWACDMIQGLSAMHNCNIIHGAIKPSNVFLNAEDTALLGCFGKTELDSARQTHQLFSKVLIGRAIPHSLVYWAPELLQLRRYGPEADMWALGVTLYEMVTGLHPFNTSDEVAFREEALAGTINLEPLEGYPVMARLIRNLLRVNPDQRWTTRQALLYVQNTFAISIQRRWRAFHLRKEFEIIRHAAITIQSAFRRYYHRRRYKQLQKVRREEAAGLIQAAWRGFVVREVTDRIRSCTITIQARARAHLASRHYQTLRHAATRIQAVFRRVFWRRKFVEIQRQRVDLEFQLQDLHTRIFTFDQRAQNFVRLFKDEPFLEPPRAVRHCCSFEQYEIYLARMAKQRRRSGGEPDTDSVFPNMMGAQETMDDMQARLDKMTEHVRVLTAAQNKRDEEERRLRDELGELYEDLAPQLQRATDRLRRLAAMARDAKELDLTMAHEYEYTRWERTHEADNVVENVLRDDNTVFRRVSPVLDLSVSGARPNFVAGVVLSPGECGPAEMEVHLSRVVGHFSHAGTFRCTREPEQMFRLKGDTTGVMQVRLKFIGNTRGGNIASIRRVKVLGLQTTISLDGSD